MFLSRLRIRSTTLPTLALMGLMSLTVGVAFTAPAVGQVATEPSTPTATAHKLHVVLMVMNKKTSEFIYQPKTIVVNVGDTIEWKNKDIYQHTVTSIGSKTLNSGTIEVGKSWRYKAVKRGTFPYYCTLHPNMKGTLTVR
jgi:plastocyanin